MSEKIKISSNRSFGIVFFIVFLLSNRPAAAPPPRFLFSCISFHEAAAPTVLRHLGRASIFARRKDLPC